MSQESIRQLEQPFTLSNVLSDELFYDIWSELDPTWNSWYFNNGSYGDDPLTNWGSYEHSFTSLKASTIVKLKTERILKRRLTLIKIQYNLQTVNQICRFHKDFTDDNILTVIMFTTPTWNTQWSGEFCVQTPDGKYNYYPYIPNTAVGIKSIWEHNGMPPNQSALNNVRTSLAFSYVYSDKFDEVYKRHVVNGETPFYSRYLQNFNNKIYLTP